MIDPKLFRTDPDKVKWAVQVRGVDVDVDQLVALEEARRDCLYQVEQRRARKKEISKEIGAAIGQAKREGRETTVEQLQVEFQGELDTLDREITDLEARLAAAEREFDERLLYVPNIPADDSPIGLTEAENVEVLSWREPGKFLFEPKPHWEIGVNLGIIDFEAAVCMSGSQFVLTKGLGATMERALIGFMLDLHVRKHGYTEINPPFMALDRAMVGSGQLPKFEDDMYRLREGPYLIPTAEVPLTSMHLDEIIDGDRLPLHYTAYTPCFRSEAGSAGKETRGMIRVHQFHKVELMKFCKPEEERKELLKLVEDAEEVLKALSLPFRQMRLCTGEMSFSAVEAYDLEVWMPGMGKHVEISSCSRYGDYQARRCNTRYREAKGDKPRFVSTMNGSGLACGRTFAAILENYQQEDGSVIVPEALRPYMGGASHILPGG
ncbi:MAG: serine--tRNA ligase [Armatimonadetes bacterium]|nr:serine--tRNA ligase [Armatimonadota bacterium]